MTSLLPLLPDGPRPPATDALAGGPAAATVPGAGTPDFAGLLEAFGAPALPQGRTPDAVTTVGSAPPQVPVLRAEAVLAARPGGKILPEPGASLPPELPPELPLPAAETVAVPARPVAAPVAAVPSSLPISATAPAALPDAALRPAPRQHVHVESPAPAAAARMRVTNQMPGEDAPATGTAPEGDAGLAALPREAADPVAVAASAFESATNPQLLALVPVPLGDAVTAPSASPPPTSGGAASAVALFAAVRPASTALRAPATALSAVAAEAPGEPVAAPARPAVPATPTAPLARPRAPAASPAVADAAPVPAPALTPALAAEPIPASAPGAGALPDAGASAAPATPAAAPAPAPAPAPLPFPERPAELRMAAGAPAAAQLESAIAQVGDIREALRNARPAMTLTHAEFGAVSVRLEPAAPDQWRAVLASRDPGFVPAIHAALADRAVAAAADTSANFSGQSGAHHNGTSDQRYGSSPNQSQGSPQPYLGQSGSRDGEAAPDHRRPSTAAALAARGGSEAEDPAASTSASGGLFA